MELENNPRNGAAFRISMTTIPKGTLKSLRRSLKKERCSTTSIISFNLKPTPEFQLEQITSTMNFKPSPPPPPPPQTRPGTEKEITGRQRAKK